MMLFSPGRFGLLAFFTLGFFPAAFSQQASGAPEKPGLALVKPQPWSKEDQATVLEFQAVSNHTGYYQFRTAKQPAYQVPTAKVVTVIFYPETPPTLASAAQRAAVQKMVDELAGSAKKFPSAARLLDQASAPLKADLQKYDAGSVKEAGQWLPKSAYFQQKAAALANVLKPEILSAPKIKELVLAEDQYYIGLKELAESEPSVNAVIAGVQVLYDSRVRQEERAEILRQLNSPKISFEEASDLVKKLRGMQPQEDAAANLFLQSWDGAVGKASQLTKQIQGVQEQFEASMATPGSSPPVLSPELVTSLAGMTAAVRAYRAGSPPPMISVPLPLADALTAFGDNLPVLSKQVAEKQLLDAKSVLDSLVRQAVMIGPKTTEALAGTQTQINGDVEKFLLLRDEAKMLADNANKPAALKKYQQAFELIPEKDIAEQIEAMKKP